MNEIEKQNKLTIKEAKELYKKYLKSKNELEKNLYIQKTILGTIYVVNDYIEANNFKIFENSIYDIEDFRSSYIEGWIRVIKNGELLGVNSFSPLIQRVTNNIENYLGISNIDPNNALGINPYLLPKIIRSYIEYKNVNSNKSFLNYIDLELKKQNSNYTWKEFYTDESINSIIPFLENIYNYINKDKYNDIKLSEAKIDSFINLLIENGLTEYITNNIEDENNVVNSILNKLFIKDLIKEADNELTDKEKEIIHLRFGIDNGEPQSLGSLAKQFHLSRERIRQIESSALDKLKNSKIKSKYKQNNKSITRIR